ncbi:MAG: hypothetical protein II007_00040, partial [Gammaproteobacteria bacterium]|nr:hypothetical protein [Gammaproteobacteria bacterium]
MRGRWVCGAGLRLRCGHACQLRRQIAPTAPGCGVPPPRDGQEEGGLTLLLHLQQAPEIVNLAADLVFCRFPGS